MWTMAGLLWWSTPAWADECLCLTWDDDWQWSDCAAGARCPCACGDEVPHAQSTTPFLDTGAAGATVCTAEGLGEPPREGAECVLRASECVASDCTDPGCRCSSGPGAGGAVPWAAGSLLLLRGRRPWRRGGEPRRADVDLGHCDRG